MNSTRNLPADHLQLTLTNIISTISTITNLLGFYIILMQKTRENRTFTYAQLLYQIVLYLSQFYAGTVLNLVFLFPIPGAYCIGWLKHLTGTGALVAFIVFDLLFSFQGVLLAGLMVLKVGAIARPNSPFKMTPFGQNLFLYLLFSLPLCSQAFVLLATQSTRSQIELFLSNEHPSMTFLLRYPFIWMLTTTRHFVALITNTFGCIGIVFLIFLMCFIILIFELDLQVNSMSRATNKYHKKMAMEFLIHTLVSLQFFVLVPLVFVIKFFLNEETDLSIITAIAFSFFVFAPIPSILIFILKNPFYRAFIIAKIGFPCRSTRRISAARGSSKFVTSRVSDLRR